MTVDTNIIIAYLSGDEKIIEILNSWQKLGSAFFLSTIVEAEVLSFSNMTYEERRSAEKFLEENFVSVPFDRALARIAADIRVKTKIKFPDAAIAATALFTHTPLVTRNVKDFKSVSGLQIFTI